MDVLVGQAEREYGAADLCIGKVLVDREVLGRLLDLATKGCADLTAHQQEALAELVDGGSVA